MVDEERRPPVDDLLVQESYRTAVAPEERVSSVWVALYLLFGLLIALALAGTFVRINPEERNFVEELKLFQRALSLRNSDSAQSISLLKKIVESTDKVADQNSQAARLNAVARIELGEDVAISDVQGFDKKSKMDQAFQKLLASPPPNHEAIAIVQRSFEPRDITDVYAMEFARERSGIVKSRYTALPMPKSNSPFVLGLLSLMTLVGFIVVAIWFTSNWKQDPGSPLMPMSLLDADRLAARVFTCFCAFIVMPVLLSIFQMPIQSEIASAVKMLCVGIAYVFIIRAAVYGKTDTVSRILGKKSPLIKLAVIGLGGACAAIPIAGVAAWVGTRLFSALPEPSHPISVKLSGLASPLQVAAMFLSACILAPFLEELTFRGMLLPALERIRNSRVFAVSVSSFLFAAIHPQGIPLWLALGAVGAVSCVLVYRTGSLLPSMIMHGAFNCAILLADIAGI